MEKKSLYIVIGIVMSNVLCALSGCGYDRIGTSSEKSKIRPILVIAFL